MNVFKDALQYLTTQADEAFRRFVRYMIFAIMIVPVLLVTLFLGLFVSFDAFYYWLNRKEYDGKSWYIMFQPLVALCKWTFLH